MKIMRAKIVIDTRDDWSESELEALSDKLEELDILQKLESAMRELLRERLGESFYKLVVFIEE